MPLLWAKAFSPTMAFERGTSRPLMRLMSRELLTISRVFMPS